MRWRRRAVDLEEDSPLWASTRDERVSELRFEALRLAREERDPQEAIARLAQQAGEGEPGRRRLREAAHLARSNGRHHDTPVDGLTHRLLQAAANGEPLMPVTESDRQQFEAVASFLELSDGDRWALLAAREPALGELETGSVAPESARRLARKHAVARARTFVHRDQRLAELVGPRSGQSDPLLRSGAAHSHAYWHLREASGSLAQGGQAV